MCVLNNLITVPAWDFLLHLANIRDVVMSSFQLFSFNLLEQKEEENQYDNQGIPFSLTK